MKEDYTMNKKKKQFKNGLNWKAECIIMIE